MDTLSKECVICGSVFYNSRKRKDGKEIRKYTRAKWETAKYCCHKCYWEDLKGKTSNRKQETGEKECIQCGELFKRGKKEKVVRFNKRELCSRDCSDKYKSGKNHWNWQGGKTEEHHKIRNSKEYIEWRNAVYARDNWTCRKCDEKLRSKNIVAHHIKCFEKHKKLRFNIDNGLTLCRKCHKKYHRDIGKETRFKPS